MTAENLGNSVLRVVEGKSYREIEVSPTSIDPISIYLNKEVLSQLLNEIQSMKRRFDARGIYPHKLNELTKILMIIYGRIPDFGLEFIMDKDGNPVGFDIVRFEKDENDNIIFNKIDPSDIDIEREEILNFIDELQTSSSG